jgi:hypothetical protein
MGDKRKKCAAGASGTSAVLWAVRLFSAINVVGLEREVNTPFDVGE